VLGLIVAIAVVIAIVLGTRSPTASGEHGSGSHTSGSTTVQRRDLVQTDTESGTLSYADPRTVYDGLSGTITWLPAVGQVIKPGQALYRVGGVPVILMNGTTPAYRDLNSSDSDGPDILELNRNLVALGFNPDGIVVNDVWQPATTAGVELFQQSLGESQTGEVKLGHIVFLPHNRVISAVDASLGSNGGSSGGSGNGSSAAGHPNTGPEFVSLTTTTTTPRKPHRPHKKKKPHKPNTVAALLGLLRAQSAELQAQSAQLRAAQAAARGANNPSGTNRDNKSGGGGGGGGGGGSGNGGGGGGGGNGGGGSAGGGSGSGAAVLETSSTRLVATVDLDATKQSEAKVGEPVTVEMPGGSTVNGKVTAVSPVAQSSSNSDNGSGGGSGNNGGSGNGNGSSGATIPVTIALAGRTSGAGLDQAAVSVSFAQAEAKNVRSVPVTALLAVAGGNYAVQEAAAPHKLIPVTTGLFAAGYVQISGRGIYPGLAVTDSQG
jgi:hypothetical protein